jgi:hypothetical protein
MSDEATGAYEETVSHMYDELVAKSAGAIGSFERDTWALLCSYAPSAVWA